MGRLSTQEIPLREKCLYSGLFWSSFSRIRTEYGEILCISTNSVRMREKADQNNSQYEHFLRSVQNYQKCQMGVSCPMDIYKIIVT